MKKLLVALLTVIAISSTQQIVKADTIDDLRTAYTEAQSEYDEAYSDTDYAEARVKKLSKKVKKNNYKLVNAKSSLKKARNAEKKALKKLNKAESKYNKYMHKLALTSTDVRAFSYVANHSDKFTNDELVVIAGNYCKYAEAQLGVDVEFTTDGTFSENIAGYYTQSTNTVSLNAEHIDYYIFNTVAHECRHAWQHTQSQFDDSFNNYVSPEQNYSGYYNQLVEVDARAYGEQMLNNLFELDY